VGSAFYNSPIDLSTSFDVAFSETSSDSYYGPADGFAFVLQNDTRGVNALGGGGGNIGYGGIDCPPATPTCSAITPSGIVEFDTYYNAGSPIQDPAIPPYAAWMENGDPGTHYNFGAFSYSGNPGSSAGATEYFWVDYNAPLGSVSVFENASGSKAGATLLFTQSVSLPALLGASTAYLGFTGATGQLFTRQVISNFSYTTGYLPPNNGSAFDIESSNFYCAGGGTTCVPSTYTAEDCYQGTVICPNAYYADVEAIGPPTGSAAGTPDQLVLQCAQGTSFGYNFGIVNVVSKQGNVDYPPGSTSDPGVYGNSDVGTISGKGTVFNDPTNGTGSEDNPAQTSSVNATAYDPWAPQSYYTIGSVTGTQNTNNSSDTLNSGQFSITMRGTLYHVYANSGSPIYVPYQGSISCVAGGPHAGDLATAGLTSSNIAEGEVESILGDNTLVPSAG